MSDDYFGTPSRRAHLTGWIGAEMLRGAGYAAAAVVGFGLIFLVIWAISLLLPEESKQAPDPNTWSALVLPVEDTVV
ncbi:RC-LH1 core complex protein PufX [Tabrizicola sp.]|uniref:RC-LH1 core complex protein PufX n=1 Tax=Tabrizicola sp. TaxID=2005166 RepID=UPI00286B6125|nr:RC-LH1 core complex protein PufX [Tabrizicola sp.]